MTDTAHGLGRHGFRNLKCVNFNLGAPALIEEAVKRGEGLLAKDGPLIVRTWADKTGYDAQARKLVSMFRDNFKKFEAHVGQDVLQAAPELAAAAE